MELRLSMAKEQTCENSTAIDWVDESGSVEEAKK